MRHDTTSPHRATRRRRLGWRGVVLAVVVLVLIAVIAAVVLWRRFISDNPEVPPLELLVAPFLPYGRAVAFPDRSRQPVPHPRPRPVRVPRRSRRRMATGAAGAAVAMVFALSVLPRPAAAATPVGVGTACRANAIGTTAVAADGSKLVCTRVGDRTTFQLPPGVPAGGEAAPGSTGMAGSWTVGTGSVAGYRVQELLAGKAAKNPAVGRTDKVSGQLTVAAQGKGWVVRDVKIVVDLASLKSDQPRRDNRIRTSGLETDQFPTAEFVTTADIVVPASVERGETVTADARGRLTLHGVSKAVTVPVKAVFKDGRVQVLVSTVVRMADYDITPPSIAGVVTVDDRATIEALLVMNRVYIAR